MCDKDLESVCVKTPIGDMTITACPKGVHRLSLKSCAKPDLNIKVEANEEFVSKEKVINDSIDWLKDYFQSGQQKGVSAPPVCSHITRSEFNRKVWLTLMNGTKFGQTISYSDLGALSVGKANASRAVGGAMKNNPLLLMVPCHRVVKKDGKIGNFSAGNGNSLKEWLISYEKQFSHK